MMYFAKVSKEGRESEKKYPRPSAMDKCLLR
jgi:hypothetical protein